MKDALNALSSTSEANEEQILLGEEDLCAAFLSGHAIAKALQSFTETLGDFPADQMTTSQCAPLNSPDASIESLVSDLGHDSLNESLPAIELETLPVKGSPQAVPQFGCFLGKDKKAASRPPLTASVKPVARQMVPPLVSHWRDTHLLGRGTYGDVVMATEIETGDVKSVKIVDKLPFSPANMDHWRQMGEW
jgi:hypothetical protein